VVKNSISFKLLPTPSDLEILSAEITADRFNFMFCVIYRQPSTTKQRDSLLLEYLGSINGSTNIILTGDLSLLDADWNTYSGNTPISDAFTELFYSSNLCQIVDVPTHIAGNILDIILTNLDDLYNIETHPILPFGLSSDHYPITFLVKYHFVKEKKPNDIKI